MIHVTALLAAQHHLLAAHAHRSLVTRLLGQARWGLLAAAMSCASCGTDRTSKWRLGKWCNACYFRWLKAGRPASGPPPRPPRRPGGWFAPEVLARNREYAARERAAREAEVARLSRIGLTAEQIGWKLGIDPRTVTRYRSTTAGNGQQGGKPVDAVDTALAAAPPQISPADYAEAARVIACHARDAAEFLMLAGMLGVPATAFAAARGQPGCGR